MDDSIRQRFLLRLGFVSRCLNLRLHQVHLLLGLLRLLGFRASNGGGGGGRLQAAGAKR